MTSPAEPCQPLRLHFWQEPLPAHLDNATSAEAITQALLATVREDLVVGHPLGPARFYGESIHDNQSAHRAQGSTVKLRLGEVQISLVAETQTNASSKARWWDLSSLDLYLSHPANAWTQLDEAWQRCTLALEGMGYGETSLEWNWMAIKTWQLAESLADDGQLEALGTRWVQAVLNVKDDDGQPVVDDLNLEHLPTQWVERALDDPGVMAHCCSLSLQHVKLRHCPRAFDD